MFTKLCIFLSRDVSMEDSHRSNMLLHIYIKDWWYMLCFFYECITHSYLQLHCKQQYFSTLQNCAHVYLAMWAWKTPIDLICFCTYIIMCDDICYVSFMNASHIVICSYIVNYNIFIVYKIVHMPISRCEHGRLP